MTYTTLLPSKWGSSPKNDNFISCSVRGAELNGEDPRCVQYAVFGYNYKRLNNCATPALDSDDVLVVEEEAFLCAWHAKETTTKLTTMTLGVSK